MADSQYYMLYRTRYSTIDGRKVLHVLPDPVGASEEDARARAEGLRSASTLSSILGPYEVTYDEDAERETSVRDRTFAHGHSFAPPPDNFFDKIRDRARNAD